MVFLQEEEWTRHTKIDYLLAQVCAEIRVFREGFSSSPKKVSVQEFLDFTTEKPIESKPEERQTPLQSTQRKVSKKPRKTVEIGSKEAREDPEWQQVSKNAKQIWAERLGFKSIEDLANGGSVTDSGA